MAANIWAAKICQWLQGYGGDTTHITRHDVFSDTDYPDTSLATPSLSRPSLSRPSLPGHVLNRIQTTHTNTNTITLTL